MSLSDRIAKARIDLMIDFPFWGTLISRLTCIEDASVLCPTSKTPTACTDGKVIRYHPEMGPFTGPELAFVLAHEAGHPAFGHLWRRGHRDPVRWNHACDYALNLILAEVAATAPAKLALPKGLLLDEAYRGMSAEQIYEVLPAESAGHTLGDFTEPAPDQPGDGGPDGLDGNLQEDWKTSVVQAANVERQRNRGQLPGDIERLLGEAINPSVPWDSVMREFCRSISRDDYSFSRPNRRYLGSGFCLPSLHSERLGVVVAVVDTSGSVNDALIATFIAELQSFMDQCRPTALHLIDCDARVHQHLVFVPGDDMSAFRSLGGGGTSFRPPFELIERENIEPAALLYFTDLWGSFPEEPAYPVLWLGYGTPRTAPFGTTIHVIP